MHMAFQPQGNGQQDSTFKFYIVININNQRNECDYTIDERVDHNQDWGRNLVL